MIAEALSRQVQNLFFFNKRLAVSIKICKREPRLFKEDIRCTETLCLCSKSYCCYYNKSNKFKLSSKGLNTQDLQDSRDGPMSKYIRVLDGVVNLTSTNREFTTVNQMVATYKQTKK